MIQISETERIAREELRKRRLMRVYSEYVEQTIPRYAMTKFHKYLCDKIQEFEEHDCPSNLDFEIFLLSVPPQHGKSTTLTETLPSWLLTRDPTMSVIIAGYEGTFAEGFNRKNRDKFQEFATAINPKAKPNPDRQSVSLWATTEGGQVRAAGFKGGITGHPAHRVVIDDPIKDSEQAGSETIISRIHEQMVTGINTRIAPGGKLYVIQTRWVENDVIGWIRQNWPEKIYRDINIPCECFDEETDPLGRKLGESLIGEHMGDDKATTPRIMWRDIPWMLSKKRGMTQSHGMTHWNALYQGTPTAGEGSLFLPENMSTFNLQALMEESPVFEYMLLSIDATFKDGMKNDFVAMSLWALWRGNIYMLDLIHKRMGFVNTLNEIRRLIKQYPDIDQLIIEDKANGPAIIDSLQYEENVPSVVGINPEGGKYSRAQAVSGLFAGHRVFLNDNIKPENFEWYKTEDGSSIVSKIISQFTSFPFAQHDDIVDSTTQALARLKKILSGDEIIQPKMKFTRFVEWTPDFWEDYNRLTSFQKRQFVERYGAPLQWQKNPSYYESGIEGEEVAYI